MPWHSIICDPAFMLRGTASSFRKRKAVVLSYYAAVLLDDHSWRQIEPILENYRAMRVIQVIIIGLGSLTRA